MVKSESDDSVNNEVLSLIEFKQNKTKLKE